MSGSLPFDVSSDENEFVSKDADGALVATGPPALPVIRGAMPPPLEGLVRRCLARQPEQRPQSATELRDLLQSMTASAPEPVAVRDDVARAALRAPDPPPTAIEPQWRRPAASEPSPGELRSQGFRRGLLAAALALLLVAAGLVFFALPQWVERNEAVARAPVPSVAVKPAPAAPARDLQQLAELKRQVDELRPVVAGRLAGLEKRSAGSWGGAQFARGKQRLAAADVASGSREYSVALARLREADADLQAVEQRVDATLRAALAAGFAAVESGDAVAARRQFDTALAIDASNAAAKRGLRRLDTLNEVRRLLAEAAEQERNGQTDSAAVTYRKALSLDPDTVAARSALARLDAHATGNAFGAAVAEALAAMSRKDYPAARAAFERAGRIRPAAPEVREGLEQIERAIGDRSIGSHLEAAQKAEREERWGDALIEYRKALKIDANLLAAQQGVERAEPRAMLDAELTSYLQRPERVFSSDMRGAARATIAQASAVQNPGPVLSRQVSELRNLVAAAETPIRLAIASDNQTEVVIYRVGKLGAFERKDMDLLPGRYTIVGTRAGFRDVRREVTIMPGHEPPALVIRCEEQI